MNLVDPTTNQTVQTLPAREVVYGIPAALGDAIYVKYTLIILADNGNTGYSLHGITKEAIELDEGIPVFVRQAFDSFELIKQQQPSVEGQPIARTAPQPNVQNNATSPFNT